MRIVPKTEVVCDLTSCQERGKYLTCYHSSGKVGYKRCQHYWVGVKRERENNRLEKNIEGDGI